MAPFRDWAEQSEHGRAETALFRTACRQAGPWLEPGNLGFTGGSHGSLRTGAGCARVVCVNNTAYAEHLLSLGESGVLVCARQGCLGNGPQETPWGWASNELP